MKRLSKSWFVDTNIILSDTIGIAISLIGLLSGEEWRALFGAPFIVVCAVLAYRRKVGS